MMHNAPNFPGDRTNDKAHLLDWGVCSYNEFYYDIASFGNVQFEDALELFFDVYLEKKKPL